jgi:hypothetical protein
MAVGMAKKAVYEGIGMDLTAGLHRMCQSIAELMVFNDNQKAMSVTSERGKSGRG